MADADEFGHTADTRPAQAPVKSGRIKGAQDMQTPARGLPRRLYALRDAAAYLGVSVRTIRELIWKGELPQVRVARRVLVDLRDLDLYISAQKSIYRKV